VRIQYHRLIHVKGLFAWLIKERILLYNQASEL